MVSLQCPRFLTLLKEAVGEAGGIGGGGLTWFVQRPARGGRATADPRLGRRLFRAALKRRRRSPARRDRRRSRRLSTWLRNTKMYTGEAKLKRHSNKKGNDYHQASSNMRSR